jgi:glyoxylase-like metal-dependent hydrolase (beta-lactamase superfamily II)
MQILPDIHRIAIGKPNIKGLYPPNVYMILGERVAIIDTGYNQTHDINTRSVYLGGLGDPQVQTIILTHRHIDHVGGASSLHRKTKAPIVAHANEKTFIEDQLEGIKLHQTVEDNEIIDIGNFTLQIIHTPGHTMGSICILIKEMGVLFTGDTIMGFGTSVINPDEGDMGLFLDSLNKLLEVDCNTILPGHGNPVLDPKSKIHELIEHRLDREQKMLKFLGKKKRKIDDFLKEFYIKPGINPDLHDMARSQIKAHLNKLESENKVEYLGKESYSLL